MDADERETMGHAFTVPGAPRPKGRARVTRGGHAYTPGRTRSYEALVATVAMAAGVEVIEGPVRLTVHAYLPRPKRLCRRKDDPCALPAPSRPDLDNIVKAISDGLDGVAWRDDAQVVEVYASKWFHSVGGVPRCEVRVERIGE